MLHIRYISTEILVFLYVLFFVALLNPQRRTVTIQNITPTLFEQLSFEHGETLSCPCSTITMTYNTFVISNISSHAVCSSIFVSREWIEALYIEDASRYAVMDFRTTAKSQVSLFTINNIKFLVKYRSLFQVRPISRFMYRFERCCLSSTTGYGQSRISHCPTSCTERHSI